MIDIPLFTGFLKMSNYITLIAFVALIGAYALLTSLKKRKSSFQTRMMTALVMGLVIGIAIDLFGTSVGALYTDFAQSEITSWFSIFGSGFIRLVQLLAVPIVFLSIIEVITKVEGTDIRSLTGKTFAILLGTTAISVVVMIILLRIFPLDATSFTGEIAAGKADQIGNIGAQSFPEFFLNLVPNNIFSVFSDNGAIVSVVITAGLFGSAIRFLKGKKPEKVAPFLNFLTSSKVVVNSVLTNVIKIMPYGVTALVATTIISNGLTVIMSVISFILVLYLGVVAMLIVYMGLLLLVGVNPFHFYKKAFTTMLFAFSSRSSVGTLPYTLNTLKDLGVSDQSGNFVATLGTSIGMNGCAGIFPAMLGILLATATGVEMNITFYILLIIVVTVGSIGIAGVPGTATVAATVTLNSLGLGAYMSRIGAIFGIDPIIDMGRTMINVTGSMVSAIIVDRWEGTFDSEQFKLPPATDDEVAEETH